MSQKYVALRVSSDAGNNVYRAVGLAAEGERGHPMPSQGAREKWPEKIIFTLESEHLWVPVFHVFEGASRPVCLQSYSPGLHIVSPIIL